MKKTIILFSLALAIPSSYSSSWFSLSSKSETEIKELKIKFKQTENKCKKKMGELIKEGNKVKEKAVKLQKLLGKANAKIDKLKKENEALKRYSAILEHEPTHRGVQTNPSLEQKKLTSPY